MKPPRGAGLVPNEHPAMSAGKDFSSM